MDNLERALLDGIKKMEELRDDYKAKKLEPVVIEACDNMINHAKRAAARGLFPNKVNRIKDLVAIMIEAQIYNNTKVVDCMAEQLIYEMIISK